MTKINKKAKRWIGIVLVLALLICMPIYSFAGEEVGTSLNEANQTEESLVIDDSQVVDEPTPEEPSGDGDVAGDETKKEEAPSGEVNAQQDSSDVTQQSTKQLKSLATKTLVASPKVTIDGVKYECNADGTAKVVGVEDSVVDLVIPEKITNGDQDYKVTSFKGLGGGRNQYWGREEDGSNIKSVVIPKTITSIPYASFEYCRNLETVVVEGSLTYIGYEAFCGCTNLKSIEVKGVSHLDVIEGWAFLNSPKLEAVKFAEGSTVKELGDDAFAGYYWYSNSNEGVWVQCPNLKVFDIQITESVGEFAFYGGSSLTKVDLASSVNSIGRYAFSGCKKLTAIGDCNLENLTAINNYIFNNCQKLVIPKIILNGIDKVGDRAFTSCYYINSISISDSIEEIGTYAFMWFGYYADSGKITIDASEDSVALGDYALHGADVEWLRTNVDKTVGDKISNDPDAMTLQEAVNAMAAGTINKIVLEKNVILDKAVNVPDGEAVKIESHGFNIYFNSTLATAPTQLFEIKGDLTIDMKDGKIDGLKNIKIIMKVNGGNLTLTDGTITGAKGSVGHGGVVITNKGNFTMNGGKITKNTFSMPNAGGVGLFSGKFILNDGIISANKGVNGAGVAVQTTNKNVDADFIMNGGTITGNSVSKVNLSTSGDAGGGGVSVYGPGSSFELKNGTIENNTSTMQGGGICITTIAKKLADGKYSVEGMGIKSFTMSGGKIINNKALGTQSVTSGTNGSGGGLYLFSENCTISGGLIENNYARNLGGGIYQENYCEPLQIYNVAVYENEADIMGGGIWTCPRGDAKTYVNNGGAIFDNTAGDAGDDFAAINAPNGSTKSTLANHTLGGGRVDWYKDGAVNVNPIWDTVGSVNKSIPRYPNTSNEPVTVIDEGSGLALKAVLVGDSVALAKAKAEVIITGNTASQGGGIGSNGSLQIGTDNEGAYDINVEKIWKDVDNAALKDEEKVKVSVNLIYNYDGKDYVIDTVELNADKEWKDSFKGIPSDVEIKDLSVKEVEVNGFVATYSEITKNEEGDNYSVTVTNTKKEVLGEEKTPEDGSVLGQYQPAEESGDDAADNKGSVLGEEAKTSDNMSLWAVGIVALLALMAASIVFATRKKVKQDK